LHVHFATPSNIVIGQAADDVKAKYDLIVEAFGTIQGFLQRLKHHLRPSMDMQLKEIAIKILAQILMCCASITKVVRDGRASGCHLMSTVPSKVLMVISNLCQRTVQEGSRPVKCIQDTGSAYWRGG
jgi:hypothetical protein